ncbi:Catenin alpha-2 [Pteropus alecto]|uniref:Catenin alpha-2 n=1 Tax=Pteropus alecto TaxID=9402 RepID=L5L5X8_PTEAL|nr:Catenin alpha-2 [Pteropus alecto]
MTSATSPIILKWDPKSLEIRTLTVERLLEPLVTQVTTLVNTSNKGPSGKKKGRSKKAHVLAASVEQATQNFLEKGEQIAKESQDLKEELVAAVEDVRKQDISRTLWLPVMCEKCLFSMATKSSVSLPILCT